MLTDQSRYEEINDFKCCLCCETYRALQECRGSAYDRADLYVAHRTGILPIPAPSSSNSCKTLSLPGFSALNGHDTCHRSGVSTQSIHSSRGMVISNSAFLHQTPILPTRMQLTPSNLPPLLPLTLRIHLHTPFIPNLPIIRLSPHPHLNLPTIRHIQRRL